MKRRTFISYGTIVTGGAMVISRLPLSGSTNFYPDVHPAANSLYNIFKNPANSFRPYVRWWWNGDMVQADELLRELHLLKKAGIGGVEINPIKFPSREEGDDLGIRSLEWLSDEWIGMLQIVFDEAKRLGISCDLIVGSGWPFGSESLKPEERAEVVIINAEKVEGPAVYKTTREELFTKVDPGVTVPCPDRSFEILSLKMVPDPMNGLNEVTDLHFDPAEHVIRVDIPAGNHVVYALVKVSSFASVINGAPGAAGPILNHMDKKAVRSYLDRMSETIEAKTGPLSDHLRAFFTDSMELEGCNWTGDFADEFNRRRGYDIMPWLPFIMFKVGRLGAVVDDKYGATKSAQFAEEINRVRFDFETTKAELLNERFTQTYLEWCRDHNVKSRAQAYGRGFFPLETSLGYDIPEGESWTTNWLKHLVGFEMPDDDYRRGRAYTMINKYVSSAAHLAGKRVVSCEEMTNTYLVFNTSLELLKAGSDQSIMSGITHSVWHGFNYSPPEAPYPGWIQYGSYYNEKNNWWPYFSHLNNYKARISSLLQNADMYSDIAILPANNDLWSEMGVQTDPFPEKLNIPWTSLLWEAINKNGGAADYTSEIIIRESEVVNGTLCYGPKKYCTIILAGVSSISLEALEKLNELVVSGGKVICIEKYPSKSPGYNDYRKRDAEVQKITGKMKSFPESFILLKKPEDNRFLEWYGRVMKELSLPNYMDIENPDRFLMQVRYRDNDNNEIFFFANANLQRNIRAKVVFNSDITRRRYPWVLDPETGDRYRIYPDREGMFEVNQGPAGSMIIMFDKNRHGEKWKQVPSTGKGIRELTGPWKVEFSHCRGDHFNPVVMDKLQDLKDIPAYCSFSGTVIYRCKVILEEPLPAYINLGKVNDIAELRINNRDCGTRWYGDRVFRINGLFNQGENEIEIRVITLMGNYMKSLTGNQNAQYWTNLGRKNQPPVSIGLTGPVSVYSDI